MTERFITETLNKSDTDFDISLRPAQFGDFVGQAKVRERLELFVDAAKGRKDVLDHVLLSGPPGLGKTTLAYILANSMKVNIKSTSGPVISKPADLAGLLTNLEKGDILFIDEIHRMNRNIEEVLYPAMEDYALDIVIGKGPTARTLRLDLKRFTLIGATTRISLISGPLRDRFGSIFHLDFYGLDEMAAIVKRTADLLSVPIAEGPARLVASRSRRTPRIANRLLKRVRDYAQVKGDGVMDDRTVDLALEALEIDPRGLDETDRRVLRQLIEKFNGGPIGLNTLAAALNEEIATLEDVIEPFLLQEGFLNRTPRGRTATDAAYGHLGYAIPKRDNQPPLSV